MDLGRLLHRDGREVSTCVTLVYLSDMLNLPSMAISSCKIGCVRMNLNYEYSQLLSWCLEPLGPKA